MPDAELRVRLPKPLRGFRNADTSSEPEGRLQAGTYRVLEQKLKEDGGETDFVRVEVPDLPGDDTWICIRWQNENYGELFAFALRTPPPATDWSTDPLSIPESELVALLPSFHDYSYVSQGARYPFELEGFGVRQGPPQQNNCCTFVEALVVKAWQNVHQVPWNKRLHNLMMIIGPNLFGPITAIEDAGIGVRVADPDVPPQPWTAIQGWTAGNGSGHTFFVVAYDAETDRVLTLESNRAFGLDGVGFRRLGNVGDQLNNRPPPAWASTETLPTWEQICTRYVSRECATLKVTDVRWASGG